METTSISIRNKKFVNRGFLIGPVCPIYGYGVVLVSLLLQKYQNDIIVTFFMSIIICGFLEYFTSYFMEIIFKARWWDYSNIKWNLDGYICFPASFPNAQTNSCNESCSSASLNSMRSSRSSEIPSSGNGFS